MTFTVVAGTFYEDGGKNFKYISEPFDTREAAVRDFQKVRFYPFAYIENDEDEPEVDPFEEDRLVETYRDPSIRE